MNTASRILFTSVFVTAVVVCPASQALASTVEIVQTDDYCSDVYLTPGIDITDWSITVWNPTGELYVHGPPCDPLDSCEISEAVDGRMHTFSRVGGESIAADTKQLVMWFCVRFNSIPAQHVSHTTTPPDTPDDLWVLSQEGRAELNLDLAEGVCIGPDDPMTNADFEVQSAMAVSDREGGHETTALISARASSGVTEVRFGDDVDTAFRISHLIDEPLENHLIPSVSITSALRNDTATTNQGWSSMGINTLTPNSELHVRGINSQITIDAVEPFAGGTGPTTKAELLLKTNSSEGNIILLDEVQTNREDRMKLSMGDAEIVLYESGAICFGSDCPEKSN